MKLHGVTIDLAALLAAFCMASCITTDHTVGSGLVPTDQDITLKSVTLDLPVGLRMADSLQTAVSQNVTVGAIRTERFGLFHSDGAMTLVPAYDSIVWGKNPTVRSLSLTLALDTALVVHESQRYIPQNLYVHNLSVQLDSTTTYNNSLTGNAYDPAVLSDGGTVYTGGSSYTVQIKKEFGERLFRIPMSTLDSAELFMKEIHGLYLRCDDPEEGTEGGRLNSFDLSSSYMTLTYDYDDDEGNRKTTSALFLVGTYYTVNRCSAGSRTLEQADPADGLYMEGICGIKPHIDARTLRARIEAWAAAEQISLDELVVAKATLSFPFEYDGDREQFDSYSGNLFPCRRVRGSYQTIYAPISDINDTETENGAINRSLLTYTASASIYVQDLVRRSADELTEEDDLWIMPTTSYYSTTTGTTYYYADSFYYTQDLLNGTAAARHPVIKLTYTILK